MRRKEESTWATSYADFLMVLLSFFIVFFSAESKSVLFLASQGMKSIASPVEQNTPVTIAQSASSESQLSALIPSFRGASFQVTHEAKHLVVDLADNIFPVGGYDAPGAMLNQVASILERHQSQLVLTIIGESDQIKFGLDQHRLVEDNLSLAGMRAAKAAVYLKNQLPGLKIKIEGSDQSRRSTRSLSLILEGRGDQK